MVVHLWSSHGSRPASRTYQRRIWNFRTVSLGSSVNKTLRLFHLTIVYLG